MTFEEFKKLPADGKVPCPKCGGLARSPKPGCDCPIAGHPWGYTVHINKNHHICVFGQYHEIDNWSKRDRF